LLPENGHSSTPASELVNRRPHVWPPETRFTKFGSLRPRSGTRARGGRISLQPNGLSGSPAVVTPITPSHFRFYGCSIRREEKVSPPQVSMTNLPCSGFLYCNPDTNVAMKTPRSYAVIMRNLSIPDFAESSRQV